MKSSSSIVHASASEHALSNERKHKELQDLQDGKVSQEWRDEWRAKKSKAVLEERAAKGGSSEDVMDMENCVRHISAIRGLAGKNDQISKFSDYWASDNKSTIPMKAVFTPAKLMHGKIEVLSRLYDPDLVKKYGEANPLNPPYFRISCELMGRVIHTMREQYISDNENSRMSTEFKEHVKVVLAPLEATVASTFTRLSEHHASSLEQALDQQVHVMVKHNDRQELMKERAENLSIQARKEFRNLSYNSLEDPDKQKNTYNVNVLKDKLREAN
jgi:hypothetical protein